VHRTELPQILATRINVLSDRMVHGASQISTGDRTILGKVSKQGNRYLRILFVQAAWAVLIKPQTWERYGLKQWITVAKRRLHSNVLAIALANKLARIAWAVLSKDCDFKCEKTDEAPGAVKWAPCAQAPQGVAWQRQRRLDSRVTASLDRPCARRRCPRTGRDEGMASGIVRMQAVAFAWLPCR
jgi:Transposase IS116/IS110/IS902 family